MTFSVALVVACAVLGGVAGMVVPRWLARLPEPLLADGETKTPYADLARWPPLPVVCGLALTVGWGFMAWRVGADPVLPAVLYVVVTGVLLGYVDLRVRLLPNAVVLPSYAVVGALLVLAAVFSGRWGSLAWAAVGGAALRGFLALFVVLIPSGIGLGDAKLGGVLGLCLGWFGPAYVLLGTFAAFVFGGLVSLGLIASRRGTLKSAIPFGPFLILGFVAAVAYGDDLIHWYGIR
ncbi:A24 family peptidase [Actinopolymorpha sp. B17G11]|uniref:A24 family peptidase n=1 Tax=Actinopolymorpha sp. B17G11 TaxID=3160861 RepID=UPI0032E4B3C3